MSRKTTEQLANRLDALRSSVPADQRAEWDYCMSVVDSLADMPESDAAVYLSAVLATVRARFPRGETVLWAEWHERLMLRRQSVAAAKAHYTATVRATRDKLAALGMDPADATTAANSIINQAHITKLEAQAAAATASRRSYEADRLDVVLRRERNPSSRGANGRRRAVCRNRYTGRESSPPAFSGGARFVAAQSRQAMVDGVVKYREVRDEHGVWLRTVLEATRGLYHQYDAPELDACDGGVLIALADAFTARPPALPDTAAASAELRRQDAASRAAYLADINRKAATRQRTEDRRDGRRKKRGKRGGKKHK